MADRENMSIGLLTLTDRFRFNRKHTVAVPPANPVEGDVAYFSDGVAGGKGLAFYDGTNWKRVDTPATTIAAE